MVVEINDRVIKISGTVAVLYDLIMNKCDFTARARFSWRPADPEVSRLTRVHILFLPQLMHPDVGEERRSNPSPAVRTKSADIRSGKSEIGASILHFH